MLASSEAPRGRKLAISVGVMGKRAAMGESITLYGRAITSCALRGRESGRTPRIFGSDTKALYVAV